MFKHFKIIFVTSLQSFIERLMEHNLIFVYIDITRGEMENFTSLYEQCK